MTNEIAPIASAVAAVFSAISAMVMVRIQRQNLIDSARPEIVLEGWERTTRQDGDYVYEVVTYKSIDNAGKGPALHVEIQATDIERHTTFSSTKQIAIIPPEGNLNINGDISLYFRNASHNMVMINIIISFWSTRNVHYETNYNLVAVDLNKSILMVGENQVARGVYLSYRNTTILSDSLRTKFIRKLAKLPFVGKYLVYNITLFKKK